MNKRFNKQAQGGFTLIELIVVIVILGILAATALPKFANLSGDARVASLQAAKGAMSSASAMWHGKWLVAGKNQLNGDGITVNMEEGYLNVVSMRAASGLEGEYTLTNVGSKQLKVTPKNMPDSLVNTCYVMYTAPAANELPKFEMPTGDSLKCE